MKKIRYWVRKVNLLNGADRIMPISMEIGIMYDLIFLSCILPVIFGLQRYNELKGKGCRKV